MLTVVEFYLQCEDTVQRFPAARMIQKSKLPKNTIFRNYIKVRIRGFSHTRKNSCGMCHSEVKCRRALWLQAGEALWFNCKRTQSSGWRFFLCKKYELLRSNNTYTHYAWLFIFWEIS